MPHDSDPGEPVKMDSGTFFKLLRTGTQNMLIADVGTQPRQESLHFYMKRLTHAVQGALDVEQKKQKGGYPSVFGPGSQPYPSSEVAPKPHGFADEIGEAGSK